jgi:superfamily I DNA and/or RNA helicase
MEPVLMSVLAVPSLRKLELVGDHYQLPAFVQNCWYNMEATHPALKVSLFERLVVGTSKGLGDGTNRRDGGNPVVPCSILDEQRRMRPAIADLTRDEYRHLVAIQDHGTTRTRRLGDVLLAASKSQPSQPQAQSEVFRTTRKLWAARGALVPGVPAQEFFWNLRGNAEGRPVAGLSACNQVEAAAVAQLVKWLLLCGVPAPAIAVITPYKGQKTAIIHVSSRRGGCMSPT